LVSTLLSATNLVEIRTLSHHRVALAARGVICRCYTTETTIRATLTLNSTHPWAPPPDLTMETSKQPPHTSWANSRPHRTTAEQEVMTVPFAAMRRSGLTLQSHGRGGARPSNGHRQGTPPSRWSLCTPARKRAITIEREHQHREPPSWGGGGSNPRVCAVGVA
jgi:hypothetical protein